LPRETIHITINIEGDDAIVLPMSMLLTIFSYF
jgi:hypothetical protein